MVSTTCQNPIDGSSVGEDPLGGLCVCTCVRVCTCVCVCGDVHVRVCMTRGSGTSVLSREGVKSTHLVPTRGLVPLD